MQNASRKTNEKIHVWLKSDKKKKKDYNNLIVKKPIRLNKTYNILLFPQKTNYVWWTRPRSIIKEFKLVSIDVILFYSTN